MEDRDQADIIASIRSTPSARRTAILHLAEDKNLKNKIINYVSRYGGDTTDGLTIFDDMIVTFIKIVHTKRDFILNKPLHAYLMGIAKNLWYNELRRKNRHQSVDIENLASLKDENIDAIELLMNQDQSNILRRLLSEMKVNCKEVLMYWAGGYKMKEIAALLGYKSDAVVRKKKSECMKELLQYLAARPNIKKQLSKI